MNENADRNFQRPAHPWTPAVQPLQSDNGDPFRSPREDTGAQSDPGPDDDQDMAGESAEAYRFLTHPLLQKSVVLPTSAVAFVASRVRTAIMLREHGICFSGPSGCGKSQALKGVRMILHEHFPDVSIFTLVILNQPANSPRAFFKHCLLTTGAGSTSGETYELKARLANKLLEQALASKLSIVVLLIDEAQQLTLEHFSFLKDLGNYLELHGAHLIVAMMAEEPSFQHVVHALQRSPRTGLSTRFVLKRFEFPTIRTETDYVELFTLIDQQIYPANSGISWPRYFGGATFRLAAHAKLVHGIIESRLSDVHSEQPVNLRQLFTALRILMMQLVDALLSGQPSDPETLWEGALDEALIQDAAQMLALANECSTPRAKVKL